MDGRSCARLVKLSLLQLSNSPQLVAPMIPHTTGLMVALGVAVVSTGSSSVGEDSGGAVALAGLAARRVVHVVAMSEPCFPETAAASSFCLLPVFFPHGSESENKITTIRRDGKFFALYE